MGDIRLQAALSIDGWMSPTELNWLAKAAQEADQILEVGSYKGRSTRALCDNTNGVVTAVDPWQGPYITDRNTVLFDQGNAWPEFERNLSDVENLNIVKKYFIEFETPETFDFIFLDGDHRYEAVVDDITKAMQLLKPGGILAGHDYCHTDWPGVKKAVDEFFPNREVVDTIWWIQKS